MSQYYNPDDVTVHFRRARNQCKPTKLRSSISTGKVLIILSGRFKGRRVVFLKQMESGLLLVTGPYKVNGVPLRRVNQAYVQPTSTVIDVSGINVSDITDKYFQRSKIDRDISKVTPWASLDKAAVDEERLNAKKVRQAAMDKKLMAVISKTPMLKKYLSKRFSLRSGTKPHDMNF